MDDGLFERWMRSAAAIVEAARRAGAHRPAGIARRRSLPRSAGRFGGAEILPVHPRADTPAIRIVVRAMRGARGALSLEPPLILHEAAGDRFPPRADAINNGRASLFGD